MSRQISFFHAEPDAVRFLQEIDRRGGTFWIGNAAVPPLSMIEAVQDKMSTHLCKFRIVPAGLAAACSASMPEAAIIEFCNCCRGNAMSRTYEVGRLYLVPACSGAYVPESATLYEALRRYLKAAYHYEPKAGAYFSPAFWEKLRTNYYHAARAGRPVFLGCVGDPLEVKWGKRP